MTNNEEQINGVSFEEWVSAVGQRNRGMSATDIQSILGLSEAQWQEADSRWMHRFSEMLATNFGVSVDYAGILSNPVRGRFDNGQTRNPSETAASNGSVAAVAGAAFAGMARLLTPTKETEPALNPERDALIARWNKFLSAIDQRFGEASQQGEQAVLQSLDDNDFDYYGSMRVLSSIVEQMRDTLIRKVDETWQDQVEPQMKRHDPNNESYWIGESFKGADMNERLNSLLRVWSTQAEGLLARKFYDYAVQVANKDFRCTQCNAPLRIRPNFFQSQYIPCQFCAAVNTFEPETRYTQLGWGVCSAIATLGAMSEFRAMEAAGCAAQAYRGRQAAREDELRREAKAAVRRYCERYMQELVKLLPDTAVTYDRDLAVQLARWGG